MDEYYRTDNKSVFIQKCPNAKACKQGDNENPLGKCAEGYKGHFCGSCDYNFVNDSGLTCNECSDSNTNAI